MALGIDAGNFQVKVVGPGGADRFSSFIAPSRPMTLGELDRDHLLVGFNGREYFAGELSRQSTASGSDATISKAHDEVLIRVLLALYRNDPDAKEHEIVVGQPIVTHTKEEKEKIKQLLQGPHDITINGEERTFRIKSVGVSPEGASVALLDPEKGRSHVIDVGSGTMNWATVEFDGKVVRFQDNESDTEEVGLTTGRKNRYEVTMEEVAMKLGRKLKSRWDPQEPVRVVGAVAELLVEPLKQYFPNAVAYRPTVSFKTGDNAFSAQVLEPVFANAAAFYSIARAAYDGKKR